MRKTTARPVRILFVGNSFTARNDLPDQIVALAAAGEPPVVLETSSVLASGASLRQHWNAGAALDAIRLQTWEYVVLQEQSTLPIKNPTRFHENVRLFDAAIKRAGAKTVLYLTWARRHEPGNQERLTDATRQIAAELDAVVVPVGEVWWAALGKDPDLPLYDKDGSHPSTEGSRLAAGVFHETLFGPKTKSAK